MRRQVTPAPKTDFGNAPPGYVAGSGRGAIGFTTRSDIGPARPLGAAEAKRPPPGAPAQQATPKEPDYSEANFDEFSGYGENLFGGGTYDKDDEEADAVYMAIDQRMDSKRKERREALLKAELEKYRKKRPRIQEQFRDLKGHLSEVSTEQWETLPEPKDYSRRNKRERGTRFNRETPMPDNLLGSAEAGFTNQISGMSTPMLGYATPINGMHTPVGGMRTPLGGMRTPLGGLRTPLGGAKTPLGFATPLGAQTPLGGPADLTQLGRARDKVLSFKLDRMADSVSGQTVVDPKGYLTDLNHVKVSSEAEVSDIKKARLLLKSVTTTNPKHAPGWIAAARLEKETGKLVAARAIIMKGCEICPTSPDVWMEAAKMQTPRNARSILAKAVRFIPTSVKIWMSAAALEESTDAKKAVLRRALELVPNSVVLWKSAIELENPEDARILLGRAVEMVPQSVEMWLALARLETYDRARSVLNRARSLLPTEPAIWITAAKLEEAHGQEKNVDAIIAKAVKSLADHQVVIDRDMWLGEAEAAEKSGSLATCRAIVKATIGIGIDPQDRKATWLADAENFVNKQSINTARAIYQHMMSVFPSKKSVRMKAAQLEKQYGTPEDLDLLLKDAVAHCPQAEDLWLMAAKEKWLQKDVAGARSILDEAFKATADSEQVWLAAVKLESENEEYERARLLLDKARGKANTARVWMKSAKLERALGNRDKERQLLEEALNTYGSDWKLWLMLAQHYIFMKDFKKAGSTFKQATARCPQAVELWLNFAQFEVTYNNATPKARSILESARLQVPKNPSLWMGAIRIEEGPGGSNHVAEQLVAKALQECPTSGIIWAHAIATDSRPLRKARSYDALKRCSDDPHVFLAVAKLFWMDRKVKKARNWFNRAVTVEPDLGDTWAWFYKFELEHGNLDKQKKIIKRCQEADPRHGHMWTQVSKKITIKESQKVEDILKEVVGNLSSDLFDKKQC